MLYHAEDSTSEPLNRGGIADLLLLRTLLAIRQKSRQPSLWEVIDSFVLVVYASLATSRTLLQRILVCLNFSLEFEDLFCWCRQKKWFLVNYGSSTSSWKLQRWVRLDLILIPDPDTSLKWSRRSSQSAQE